MYKFKKMIRDLMQRNRFLRNIKKAQELRFFRRENPTLTIEENVQIKTISRLRVGENVILQQNSILNCGGMEWCNYSGGISIGDDSCISPNCIFYGAGAEIKVGRNFDCGPGVYVFSSRTKYEDRLKLKTGRVGHYFSEVVIEDDVICYANVVISPGVRIGKGAVIAASSVVLSDVEPYTLVGGVPAKKIRELR